MLVVLLRCTGGRTGRQVVHRLHQRVSTQQSQTSRQGLGILVWINGSLCNADDIARVQLGGHIHDGHAGDLFAVENRPVDRGRAAVFGQDGGMHIDRAVGRRVQNILRQNAAIGSHHDQLRVQLLHQCQRRAVPQLQRLIHRQIM